MGNNEERVKKEKTRAELEKEEICWLRVYSGLPCNNCRYFEDCEDTDDIWDKVKEGR